MSDDHSQSDELQRLYRQKMALEDYIFSHIRRGDRIFIGTGCGEPQHLLRAFVGYVGGHPKAFFDTELFQVWSLGVAPYADERFRANFRHNSFFVGNNTRNAVNTGLADYTPVFLSQTPKLFYRRLVPIDVALVQTSHMDRHGFLSLGISVDIVKAAVESARLVIAQVNANMPRIHGDGFIHIRDVDFVIHADEPLLQYKSDAEDDIVQAIGRYVSALVQDGDTIQVGYGSIPNAVLVNLAGKKHLGVHTELLSDGLVQLIRQGVIDNSKKTLNHYKTVASFCMGSNSTYEFLNDNPAVEFRTIDYTNDPMVIARHDNMTAINSALQIDLTGQASAESIGRVFYSGIGGQADFMRGAIMAKNGKTILTLQSTAQEGQISRIVPFLNEGAGVTLNRGDVHYVVTEYGIAYLYGKNIRQRAMELIAIAHPHFRAQLIEEARALNIIYHDQVYIHTDRAPEQGQLQVRRTTSKGVDVLLRPVRISDEALLKDFFYSLSDETLYRRFISVRKDMPHERLQKYLTADYVRVVIILAVLPNGRHLAETGEFVVGMGQYEVNGSTHFADVALVIRDDYQGKGIGRVLLDHLSVIARQQGLLGFTAETLAHNRSMIRLFEGMDFDTEMHHDDNMYAIKMAFKR
ncbi:MAG: GNAT family N-acetyltransferase [Nitrospirae bacterium]|uniref:bifunctional acetyl-CoA hydrolase/transferase family protein/GNAT family N-acetyltransferase n=1 Tax=Candidatus Magnetobacterium casense TaxID=1455061 RepID=UPI0005913985|nr:bifunctional acetyl-CoA hydrolase/transferase family protein/GNAT family N-acetyltransferase [Candidatus Magnetobacterium casensis]MBF0336321.1 GNAT family N-acetyltransferase [Nitrospirota bacterium]